jgi:hypothetical protein
MHKNRLLLQIGISLAEKKYQPFQHKLSEVVDHCELGFSLLLHSLLRLYRIYLWIGNIGRVRT